MRFTRGARYWLAALAATGTAACGGDSSGPGGDEEGRFTAEITGDLEQEMSGLAFYFQSDDGFTIALTNGNQQGLGIVFGRNNAALPGEGVYQVVEGAEDLPENDFIAISFWGSADDMIQCFSIDGGELTITASGSTIQGEFSAEVRCPDLGGGELAAATITGRFHAVEGPDEGE